jgi:uncharacterized protein YgbK (DUF1537 family)
VAVNKADRLASLPAEWPRDLLPSIRAQVQADRRTIVVLDDDPTGTQTVYDLPVLTEWSVVALADELRRELPAFYVLTNSRSLPEAEAIVLAQDIGRNLREASLLAGRDVTVISRSDSTLRGHFPAETDALAAALETRFDGCLIIPFFQEGGRYTIDNVHFVEQAGTLIPAGETAYARDPAFGYRASDLREWAAEKSGGRIDPSDVAVISLADLREGGPSIISERLRTLRDGQACVVNAASYRDMEVLVAGLLAAEAQGGHYLCRTAASFVRVRIGLAPRDLLRAADLAVSENTGALIVAGSFVPTTTAQLDHLMRHTAITAIEITVGALLDDHAQADEIRRVAGQAARALSAGNDTLIYTSRDLIRGADSGHSLAIGARISDRLVQIVHRIDIRPRLMVVKGGITSSEIARYGLNIRQAWVLGQILPGVPVWRAGDESRFPGLPLVIFPGNVGMVDALTRLIAPA